MGVRRRIPPLFNPSDFSAGAIADTAREAGMTGLARGNPEGSAWVPPECDVSLRPGWFCHEREKGQVKTGEEEANPLRRGVGNGNPPSHRGILRPSPHHPDRVYETAGRAVDSPENTQ